MTVAPGSTGQFDILVDGAPAFSRHETGRFPTDAEVEAIARKGAATPGAGGP